MAQIIKSSYRKLKSFLKKDKIILIKSKLFNAKWYKKTYDVKKNPYNHYLKKGANLGYNPSPFFSRIKYELLYDEVRYNKINPLVHFDKIGKHEPYFYNHDYYASIDYNSINEDKNNQDKMIEKEYSKETENLIVFLVPDINTVNGGIMSINSIAYNMKKYKEIHNSEIIVCTIPGEKTFFNYTKFKSNFNIYRFEQLFSYFTNLKNVVVHIPEVYVSHFLFFCTPVQWESLKKIDNLKINIMNQNMDLMPRPRLINYLKEISKDLTITCAHKSYTIKQLRTSYDASVHWLSASNMVKYEYVDYEKKENLLVYSIDNPPARDMILDKIKKAYPDLKMIEIKNMKYNDYLKLIGKAKWMITFGEGLDGYFVESLRSGTLAFAAYNATFFNENFDGLENIYSSYDDMSKKIVDDLKKYDNKKDYKKIVDKCVSIDKKEYNDLEYLDNIKKYCLGDYTFKIDELKEKRKKLLNSQPLISIAVTTFNGEKYIEAQIKSLLEQQYKNIEIIVSDDGSTDNTLNILKKYENRIKIIHNINKGINNNISNAIKNCNGEFIALCDQDDIWEKNKLNILLEHIDDFDIVFSNISVIDEFGNYHPNKVIHAIYEKSKVSYYNFKDFINVNDILGCTCLIRSSFLKKYIDIPKDIIYSDRWFILNAIKNGNGIVYIDDQITKYRQHANNTVFLKNQDLNWYDKKIKQDMLLLKKFSLNRSEITLIKNDINFNQVKYAFYKYLPNKDDDYFDKNYNYFTDEFLNELIHVIKKEK